MPSGPAGTRYTLNQMRQLTREYKKNMQIRELAMALVSDLPPKDYRGEIHRLHAFVRDQIRYVRDINGVETLSTPIKTLEFGQGDCDDKATLLATLLESIGHPTQFRAVGFNGGPFAHVLVDSKLGRKWIPLETTENVKVGWTPPNPTSSMVVQN